MDIIGEFAKRFLEEVLPLLDWAVRNWALTLMILVLLIYWAGRQKPIDRNQL